MRSLASAILVVTAIGLGTPALAETMSAHQGPAAMPAGAIHAPAAVPQAMMRAHPTPASMPTGAAHRDRDDGDRRHGRHRQRIFLPFGFFDQAPAPQAIAAQPDASPAPPAPPVQAADLPPCRETSAGVVVLRGTGCTR